MAGTDEAEPSIKLEVVRGLSVMFAQLLAAFANKTTIPLIMLIGVAGIVGEEFLFLYFETPLSDARLLPFVNSSLGAVASSVPAATGWVACAVSAFVGWMTNKALRARVRAQGAELSRLRAGNDPPRVTSGNPESIAERGKMGKAEAERQLNLLPLDPEGD